MLLAVDEATPYGRETFGRAGEVRTFSGRAVGREDVRSADALIVRSVTRVDARLLEGSAVKFVGTATIGMDHLDLNYLDARGIHVTNAAGSNANAVSEYVAAALLAMAERRAWNLAGKSIGIVGVGHVGSLIEKKAAALGMEVLLCDPPLRETTGNSRYGFFEDVAGADILTLHVPLTKAGPYATRHMIEREVLRRFSPYQYIINSSRGSVVDGASLKESLMGKEIEGAVLDVWEGEPGIDLSLLDLVDIGTPHIAGFSLDGKIRGTAMVFEELCRFFGIHETWDTGNLFPPPQRLRIPTGCHGQDALRCVVLQAYNLLGDDADLRTLKDLSATEAGVRFDRLRTGYRLRCEFPHFLVELGAERDLASTFRALGFRVDTDEDIRREGP
jgi:erythronate-4-phosphate dehydrogenase